MTAFIEKEDTAIWITNAETVRKSVFISTLQTTPMFAKNIALNIANVRFADFFSIKMQTLN